MIQLRKCGENKCANGKDQKKRKMHQKEKAETKQKGSGETVSQGERAEVSGPVEKDVKKPTSRNKARKSNIYAKDEWEERVRGYEGTNTGNQ